MASLTIIGLLQLFFDVQAVKGNEHERNERKLTLSNANQNSIK